MFPTAAFDVVFVIEALCYSTQKKQVLKEVKRVLKKDGIFIVIDAFARKHTEELTPHEKLAKQAR